DELLSELRTGGGDRPLDHLVAGRVAGVGRPALAVAADPFRAERVEPLHGLAWLRTEERVIAAEEERVASLRLRIAQHRVEGRQVSVNVVEDGEHYLTTTGGRRA